MKIFGICALVLSIALVACGGGGNSVAGIDAGGAPVKVSVVAKGTIAGFGSIIVNGVRYETTTASIDNDGVVGMQSDLKVGQVVLVKGSLDAGGTNGSADSVSFGDLVEGPISAVDTVAGTITVLGQLVFIDADTSFDDSISPPSIDGLAVNDIVEVSGFMRADGSINATRIEGKPAGTEFEVTGEVSNLTATTFQINSLVVDFSMAQLDDFPSGSPQLGQLVEAKGQNLGGSGQLLATRVEFKGNDLGADAGDRVEIEGFITRFASATDFDVEGIPVTTSGSTVFVNGTAADLGINRKVEVEGTIGTTGVISATKVELELSNFIHIEGMVEAKGTSSLTIFGIPMGINSQTRLEDKSSADVQSFSLANINVGDYLETRGYEDATGVVATLV
ncbi:MAG: DUF5666 domain-containing protein [Proteobacteria bacterium]|nr:DUF5666 domain-containing protein [Pseudomonadota bacterium]